MYRLHHTLVHIRGETSKACPQGDWANQNHGQVHAHCKEQQNQTNKKSIIFRHPPQSKVGGPR